MFQYFQPTQIFSQLHPQYEYIWQFEMDARYTGHMYDLVHKATEFAKQQPRKYLWERNSYFYIPAVHGTWEEFSKKVDQEMAGHESIWGPHPAEGIDIGGKALPPPVPHPEEEPGIWGVGEEADFISWLPHFDPTDTFWPFRDKVFNFPQDLETPRRAAVVAMSRISARLLGFLHHDKKHSGVGLVSEMSPVSWAMYYGLKAVHIPHPIYHESKWDPQEINRRANPGEPGKVNAGVDSIWSWDMHNDIIDYLTFMFNNKYSERFFRKWMGLDGAEEVCVLSEIQYLLFFLTTNSGRKRMVDVVSPLYSCTQSRIWNHEELGGQSQGYISLRTIDKYPNMTNIRF
jgi:hypothetical protein